MYSLICDPPIRATHTHLMNAETKSRRTESHSREKRFSSRVAELRSKYVLFWEMKLASWANARMVVHPVRVSENRAKMGERDTDSMRLISVEVLR